VLPILPRDVGGSLVPFLVLTTIVVAIAVVLLAAAPRREAGQ
jgi:hypothetical protein